MLLETAITGAKVQSFRRPNPRDILRRLLEEEPNMSKTDLLRVYRDEVIKDEEIIDSIIEYWFSNNYHSLIDTRSVRPQQRAEARAIVAEKAAKIKQAVVSRIKEEAQIMLLDLMMPNGKVLKECTGAECARLGSRVGSWLASIAKEVKPSQRVGAVVSEEKARQLYEACRT